MAKLHLTRQYQLEPPTITSVQRGKTALSSSNCDADRLTHKKPGLYQNDNYWCFCYMKKLSHQQAGRLGEHLALAKLNSLGVAAYVSPEGAPGHDLIAIVDGVPKSIEVKTRQFLQRPTEITRWPVDLGTKGDADYFLFVELDLRTISPTFYLLNNEQARSTNRVSVGQGNCYPAHVRAVVQANDFSPLVGAQSNALVADRPKRNVPAEPDNVGLNGTRTGNADSNRE